MPKNVSYCFVRAHLIYCKIMARICSQTCWVLKLSERVKNINRKLASEKNFPHDESDKKTLNEKVYEHENVAK